MKREYSGKSLMTRTCTHLGRRDRALQLSPNKKSPSRRTGSFFVHRSVVALRISLLLEEIVDIAENGSEAVRFRRTDIGADQHQAGDDADALDKFPTLVAE